MQPATPTVATTHNSVIPRAVEWMGNDGVRPLTRQEQVSSTLDRLTSTKRSGQQAQTSCLPCLVTHACTLVRTPNPCSPWRLGATDQGLQAPEKHPQHKQQHQGTESIYMPPRPKVEWLQCCPVLLHCLGSALSLSWPHTAGM